jgi:hypothetical protein
LTGRGLPKEPAEREREGGGGGGGWGSMDHMSEKKKRREERKKRGFTTWLLSNDKQRFLSDEGEKEKKRGMKEKEFYNMVAF